LDERRDAERRQRGSRVRVVKQREDERREVLRELGAVGQVFHPLADVLGRNVASAVVGERCVSVAIQL